MVFGWRKKTRAFANIPRPIKTSAETAQELADRYGSQVTAWIDGLPYVFVPTNLHRRFHAHNHRAPSQSGE